MEEAKSAADAGPRARSDTKLRRGDLGKREADARPPNALVPTHDALVLAGWMHVRHVPKGDKWHTAKDHLKGTEMYGDDWSESKTIDGGRPLYDGDRPLAEGWSTTWKEEEVDQYLFATGDGMKFSIIDRSELQACRLRAESSDHGEVPTRVKISSHSAAPGIVKMKFAKGAQSKKEAEAQGSDGGVSSRPEEALATSAAAMEHDDRYPFISLVDYKDAKKAQGSGFLYGGGALSLKKGNSKDKKAEGPEEHGLANVDSCGGANVYIRKSMDTNGLAVCLNGLVGSPEAPELLLDHPDAMQHLWKKAPHVIFAGLAHGFYRADTADWFASVASSAGPIAVGDIVRVRPEKKGSLLKARVEQSREHGGGGNSDPKAKFFDSGSKVTDILKDGKLRIRGELCDPGQVELVEGSRSRDYSPNMAAGAAAAVAVFKELGALDMGTFDEPVRNAVMAWRESLLKVALQGRLLGPLRQAFKPIRDVGPSFGDKEHGRSKWCGAAKAPDGRLFFLPKSEKQNRLLVFDPLTTNYFLKTIDSKKKKNANGSGGDAEEWQYSSAVVGSDGCIYGIPACAKAVLKIIPGANKRDCAITSIELNLLREVKAGTPRWGQGALAADGNIYAAPAGCDAVLVIDTKASTSSCVELQIMKDEDPASTDRWWGAVSTHSSTALHAVGSYVHIRSIPVDEAEKLAPGYGGWASEMAGLLGKSGSVEAITSSGSIKVLGKFWNPVMIVSDPGAVYFTPYNKGKVLKLVTSNPGAAQEVGPEIFGGGPEAQGGEAAKYMEACITKDRMIVAAPAGSGGRKMLVFDPRDDSVSYVGRDYFDDARSDKFHGMTRGADGNAFATPYNHVLVVKVDPATAAAALVKAEEEEEKGGPAVKSRVRELRAGKDCGVLTVPNSLMKTSGKDAGLFGSAALADDGYLYAAPVRARYISRIDTLRASDPEKSHIWHHHAMELSERSSSWLCDGKHAPGGCRGTGGGSGRRHRCIDPSCDFDLCGACWDFGKRSVATGSITWLWVNEPETWFRILSHPSYRSDMLEWFSAEVARDAHAFSASCGAGLKKSAAIDDEADEYDDDGFAGKTQKIRLKQLTAADAAGLSSGTKLVFKKTSTYAYPASCVEGATVTYLRTNGGTPPAQVKWDLTSHTYWVNWGDLYRIVSGPSEAPSAATTAAAGSITFKKGDEVKIRHVTPEEAKRLQRGHGGWIEEMGKLLGQTGTVERIDSDGDVKVLGKTWSPALLERTTSGRVRVGEKVVLSGTEAKGCLQPGEQGTLVQDDKSSLPFQVRSPAGRTYWFNETDIKRAEGAVSGGSAAAAEDYREGEEVLIRDVPVDVARQLMDGKGGWVDSMAPMLGTMGTITQVLSDRVRIGGKVWAFSLVERMSGRLKVGERVLLVEGFESFDDASGGPMKAGNVGVIEADDLDSKPFKVR